MENTKTLNNKKKLLPIILAVVAIIVIIIIIALATSNKPEKEAVNQQGPETNGPVDGEQPVDEANVDGTDDAEGVEVGEAVNPVLVDAVAVVEGANLVSTEGKVITNEWVEVRTDVSSMSAEAPRQTIALDKENLPDSVIKIDVSAAGFSPSEFTVKAGKPITITLSSTDEWSHSLKFSDPKLQAAAIGVSTLETRAISFNAPSAGEYNFYCGVPGHSNRGEVGKMIVE